MCYISVLIHTYTSTLTTFNYTELATHPMHLPVSRLCRMVLQNYSHVYLPISCCWILIRIHQVHSMTDEEVIKLWLRDWSQQLICELGVLLVVELSMAEILSVYNTCVLKYCILNQGYYVVNTVVPFIQRLNFELFVVNQWMSFWLLKTCSHTSIFCYQATATSFIITYRHMHIMQVYWFFGV